MGDRYDKVLAESEWNESAKEWTHKCGTVLMAKQVHYSIWDGPGLCSGGGDVKIVAVPYCPTCEKEPLGHGVLR